MKFLQKVGIPDPRANDAAAASPNFGGSPATSGEAGGSSDVGSSEDGSRQFSEEVISVRQTAPRRSIDDVRRGYINKLEQSRAFLPQLNRPKTSQTVTIFDWDDTLLCTSHLEMVQRQYGSIPSQVREQLASIERVVLSLLEQAGKAGQTFIITNASEGWVQHSSSLCMPGLQAALEKIDIISARGAFEASFPGDSHAWKMHAFLQVRQKMQLEAVTLPLPPVAYRCLPLPTVAGAAEDAARGRHPTVTYRYLPLRTVAGAAEDAARGRHQPSPTVTYRYVPLQVQQKMQLEAVTNLVSVGDSHIEMDAVHLLGRSFAHALVKTVKLWERPTPYELQKQLEVVAEKLPDIYHAGTTLNIWLERETA